MSNLAHKIEPIQDQAQQPKLEVFNTSAISQYPPAPKGKRIIALFVDAVIAGVISQLFLVILKPLPLGGMAMWANLLVTSFIVPFCYWVMLPIKMGATPGKKFMGLKIVNENHSQPMTISRLVFREFVGKTVSAIPLLLGFFWFFFNKEGKAWHDMMMKTRVVQEK